MGRKTQTSGCESTTYPQAGVRPQRSRGVVGAYDPQHSVLMILQFTMQKRDGVRELRVEDSGSEPGKPQLGKFFELETSSPAEGLAPGQSVHDVQRTRHLVGAPQQLDQAARAILGVGLNQLQAFPK